MEESREISVVDFPVSELQSRYRINRTSVFNRMKSLGIESYKLPGQGMKAYISKSDLERLDTLDSDLKAGKTPNISDSDDIKNTEAVVTYKPKAETKVVKHSTSIGGTQMALDLDSLVPLMQETVRAIAQEFKQEPVDDLNDLDALEKACQNSWLLPTPRLAKLIGIEVKSLARKTEHYYCGFLLQRKEKRGNQWQWSIIKTVR